jgi:O-antigen/teichoic acid export membrane protein
LKPEFNIGEVEIRETVLSVVGEALPEPIPVDEKSPASPGAVTRDSVIAIIGGLASQGFKFLTLIYVARRFSAADFGIVVFAVAINAFIFVISNFGLPVFGTREVAKRGYVSFQLVQRIIASRVILSLLAIFTIVMILALVPIVGRQELLLVAVFGVSNLVLSGFLDWAFQGLARQGASAILNVIWQATSLVFVVLGVQFGIGVVAVPMGMGVGAVVASVIGFFWLKRTGCVIREVATPSLIRDSWRTGEAS